LQIKTCSLSKPNIYLYKLMQMERLYINFKARDRERILRADAAAAVKATTEHITMKQKRFSTVSTELSTDLGVSTESSTFSFLSPDKPSPRRSLSPARLSLSGLDPSTQQTSQQRAVVSAAALAPTEGQQHMEHPANPPRISISGVDYQGPSSRTPWFSSSGVNKPVSPLEDDIGSLYSYLAGDEYRELSDAIKVIIYCNVVKSSLML
jgi:hypothetical protein